MDNQTVTLPKSNKRHELPRERHRIEMLPHYRRPVRSDYRHWLRYHLPDLNPAAISTMEEIEAIL